MGKRGHQKTTAVFVLVTTGTFHRVFACRTLCMKNKQANGSPPFSAELVVCSHGGPMQSPAAFGHLVLRGGEHHCILLLYSPGVRTRMCPRRHWSLAPGFLACTEQRPLPVLK